MQNTTSRNYFEATARQRLDALLDDGSLVELAPPTEKLLSPHLAYFRTPGAFDDGIVIGEGRLDGRPVAVAAQEGRFLGGAIGEVHSARLVGLLRRCLRVRPEAVLLLFDSGGVRLQEANAGEIGVSEIIRALLDVRAAGVPVIGLVGGSCGAYGGAGILTGCCDALVISEEGRIGVSGPEVIETTMGVEVFDARDRALVWRTYGGKNRYLQGQVQVLVENSVAAFREAAVALLEQPAEYSLERLERTQAELEKRAADFAGCDDALAVWRRLGFAEPERLPGLTVAELLREGGAK
ncbi:MAG: biotin-independent malonate decarboxylase subunit beta [Lentisphaeria bacterium]|nr:biotin-independent malonate decarboxylase subunit beta [Lentisphaeria bacterium]